MTHRFAWMLSFACALACTEPGGEPPPERDAAVESPPLDAQAPRLDARALDARSHAPDARADARPDAGDDPVSARPEVQIGSGRLRGVLDQGVRTFRGVPYAAPPLRFALPQAAPPWQGTRDASEYGPWCPQPFDGVAPAMSEDCLSLNVWAPEHPAEGGAPVMVGIHGGGFAFGSGQEWDGSYLSRAGDVVVVSINYRLNALGFLAHPALDEAEGVPSGNIGIYDQQRALAWVHENIAAFGGDPGRVIVFGQSAGAVSACLHAFAQGNQDLVHGVIAQSGACGASDVMRSTADQRELGKQLAAELCPNATDVVACLRALPAQTLAEWLSSGAKLFASLASDPSMVSKRGLSDTIGWWPRIDGVLLRECLASALRARHQLRVPVIFGSTIKEALLYDTYVDAVHSRAELLTLILLLMPDRALQAAALYMPATDAEAHEAYLRLMSDPYACGTRASAANFVAAGNRAYVYDFAVAPGAHAQDLDYVFGWPSAPVTATLPGGPYPQLRSVIDAMQAYWSEFARKGDPNRAPYLQWPPYDTARQASMRLAEPLQVELAAEKEVCAFWNAP
jgi:para-nitrobenzyl esterase